MSDTSRDGPAVGPGETALARADRGALAWLDLVADGVVAVDEGRVRYLNRAAAELLGVDPTRAAGLPLIAVVRDHRLERAYLEQGSVELVIRGRTVSARAVPGGLLLRDLSEARRAQDDARELLAVLSHELRTPVTTIRGTLEALAYDLPEEQRARLLARAEAEADRLVRLLQDLTVDVRPPLLRRLALSEVAERAVTLLQEAFAETGVRLERHLPAVTVLADEDKLLQSLVNLLENAAQHGPQGGSVLLAAEEAEPGWLAVVVRDEGTPLPEEEMERLFEPHTRGARGRPGGAGLGLYIVRSIAKRWGGRAWGRPLQDGNEFGFTVPRA